MARRRTKGFLGFLFPKKRTGRKSSFFSKFSLFPKKRRRKSPRLRFPNPFRGIMGIFNKSRRFFSLLKKLSAGSGILFAILRKFGIGF